MNYEFWYFILSLASDMKVLYFYLVKLCARRCTENFHVPAKSCNQLSALIKLLEPMNFGRLLTLYAYMDRSKKTLSLQYEYHKILCQTYPSIYPSVFWMIWQVFKGLAQDLVPHFI